MRDPEPTAVPVKVTEQLPPDNIQVLELSEPPVVPGVNVKVTVPVGVFDGVVMSATVTMTLVVQLVPPAGMLQVMVGGRLVVVLSFATVIVFEAVGPLPR